MSAVEFEIFVEMLILDDKLKNPPLPDPPPPKTPNRKVGGYFYT